MIVMMIAIMMGAKKRDKCVIGGVQLSSRMGCV